MTEEFFPMNEGGQKNSNKILIDGAQLDLPPIHRNMATEDLSVKGGTNRDIAKEEATYIAEPTNEDYFEPPTAPPGIEILENDSIDPEQQEIRAAQQEQARITEAQNKLIHSKEFLQLTKEQQDQAIASVTLGAVEGNDSGHGLQELVDTGMLTQNEDDSNVYHDRSGRRTFRHDTTGRLTLIKDDEAEYSTGDLTHNDTEEAKPTTFERVKNFFSRSGKS